MLIKLANHLVHATSLFMEKESPRVQEQATVVGAFQAKTELSKLLRQTRAGKSFIITQRGTPVAELRPVSRGGEKGGRGDMRGRIVMSDDFIGEIEDMREYME